MGHADLVGVSVVLVEGDDDLRTALRLTLIHLGATVIEAHNGFEALEQVARVKPHVILCDLRLPDMDGCEFMSNLKEDVGSGHVPVIALPGQESFESLVRSMDAGFAGHLVKPVTREAIRAQIHRALGGRIVRAGVLTGVSVLVVEDHGDLREVLSTWLERAGAVVSDASNGTEALEVLATRPAPDVIVCDLHMPRMDGCAFLARLKEQAGFGHIPVIALTGSESDEALMRTLEAGFTAHLVKPVTGAALYAQIQRVLGR